MRNPHSSFAWGVPLVGLLVCCTTVTDDGKAWSQPQRIDEKNPHHTFAVALDAGGTATVLWADEDLAPGIVFSRRQAPGGEWSSNDPIDGNTEDAGLPKLAVDPNGSQVAVWKEGFKQLARKTIWSNRYTVGSGWGMAVRLDPEEGGHAADAHVAMDPGGNAIAVWHQSDGITETESIWARRSTPGDGWGPAEIIETDPRGHAGDPRVAIDPDGNAIAVWHQYNALRASILANRYTPSEGWGDAETIESNEDGEAQLPQVAMDPDGNAIVVWHQSDGSRFHIWANRFTPAGGWGAPERIDADHTGDADFTSVGMDTEGHAIAVWKQSDGITAEIWSNRYAPVDGWSTPERLDTNDEGDSFDPRLAVSASGDAVAAWLESDGSRYDVWSNAYTPGNGWGTAERIDPSDQGLGQPVRVEVAMDPYGNAMAVWLRQDQYLFATRQIWAARYE